MKIKDILSEGIERVNNGWRHSGLGYRGNAHVFILPRWNTFTTHHRNKHGSFEDIYHYMRFLNDNYQTANLDITGDEIANSMCKLYGTSPKEELIALLHYAGLPESKFRNWSELYIKFKEQSEKQQRTALGR